MKKKKIHPTFILTYKDKVFTAMLKSICASMIPHIPGEILTMFIDYLNTIYPQLKDLILNNVMGSEQVKNRELVWKNNTKKILDILHPIIHAINTQKPLIDIPTENQWSCGR